jgi:hypothetical protein
VFADFVAACHGKPYQWKIGGADTAIQWLISPIIPKIYEEMSKQAGIFLAGKQHQKAVKFFFRTGRTEALKTDLCFVENIRDCLGLANAGGYKPAP